jgi:hypothetical protein
MADVYYSGVGISLEKAILGVKVDLIKSETPGYLYFNAPLNLFRHLFHFSIAK